MAVNVEDDEPLDSKFDRILPYSEQFSEMKLNPDPEAPVESCDVLDDELVESYAAEYSSLNATMDEINSFMDALEKQNDNLFTKLQQLLENSQQTRQEMEAERLEKEQVVDLEKDMEVEQTGNEREEKCE